YFSMRCHVLHRVSQEEKAFSGLTLSSTGHPGKERALITHQARKMSLQLLPGLVSGSRRLSTIGSGGWLLNIIVLRSSFLAGPSTDRDVVGALRPQTNFLMLLSLGLEILIH